MQVLNINNYMETGDVGIGTSGTEDTPDEGDFYAKGDARVPKVIGKKKKKKIPTFKRWLKESTNIEAIKNEYSRTGLDGDCGLFSIFLNEKLNYRGEYWAGINSRIWDLGEYWLSHVGLKIDGKIYDITGEITEEELKEWGKIPEGDDSGEIWDFDAEDYNSAEVVNLSELWGEEAERKIKEWTSC
jgi:hypothetical protein|tara:strand:- start:15938 stop:16495 length:558 start_codon:yes stop_codon:yes gene_type:complete